MGGFFGVVGKGDCVADLFYGTDYHSHLGTSRGGMVVVGENGFKRNIHDIADTPFRTKFEPDLYKHVGKMGLGVISDNEDQPMLIGSQHGRYAIVTVGRVDNLQELAEDVLRGQAIHYSEMKGNEYNQTEVIASLINQPDSLVNGLRNVHEKVKGSCSALLLTDHGIYASRDRLGRTPVIIGRKEDAYAVTLETCAFPNLGYDIERELGPGEIVRITAEGVEQLSPPGDKMQMCAFLWIYYGFPASSYEGINVEESRYRCGAALARADDTKVDIVAGVPDSGVGHAIGYAAEAGIPYGRPFVKYTPTWPRSFMPQEQRVRDLVARMKLIPIMDQIKDKRLLFCEDSIVRGTQLKDVIKRLFDSGAREVHMRPACPPLVCSCKFLNFSRSRSELDLAGRRAIEELGGDAANNIAEYSNPTCTKYAEMVEKIRERLGLTSLQYQKLDDMVAAIGLPREKLCTFCWNGESLHEQRERAISGSKRELEAIS
ncbi:amidophosphoribosyltransferase [Candidatus Eisenbacteria bacterium]|uniref:Amidophosphoribosyltransferase n=1 Tax=Eiseniibacteriota bacterium TaxID=2212470 RepID=A0ABV6YLK6_UNCEI